MGTVASRQRRAGTRRAALGAALALVLGLGLAPVVSVLTASPASAATTGTIQASFTNHRGTDGSGTLNPTTNNTTANCIRYNPGSGTLTTSEARTAHGNEIVNYRTRSWFLFYTPWSAWQTTNRCPTNLSDGFTNNGDLREEYSLGQSIIGLTPSPSTTVASGTSFLLGTFRHYNNPITATASYYEGTMGVSLGGSALSSTYVLHETPNSATPASSPVNNDTVTFTNLLRTETVSLNGMTYRLSVQGFTTAGTGTAQCASTPTGSFSTVVQTVEETTTVACLWARLDQVRPLSVVKQVAAAGDVPGSIPTTTFTSASSVSNSPWAASSFSLTPTAITGTGSSAALAARDFRATGERVTLTEGVPATSWELSSITCWDGGGAALTGGVTVTLVTRQVVLENVPEATSAQTAPIVCTFVNTYVAPTVLTLISTTIPSGTAAVPTPGWSFTVDAVGAPLVTAGAAGSVAATIPVPAGNRVVRITETLQTGYVFDSMVCRRNDVGALPVTVTVNPYDLTLERGRSYTCSALNLRYGVDLVKQAYLATDTTFTTPLAAGQERQAGTPVVWRYTVRNTGQTPLTGIVLRDAYTVTPTVGSPTTGHTVISCPGRPDIPSGTTVTIPSLAAGAEISCQSSGVL
ncbi:choice-of-anchor K domain-containing protein [Cellulomonas phragmiteti]|uniref:SpaA-like prealbumin fold domain-containing protein n=1 Tax=Cellulomonas phragmiteti TaxID=478780 RepID=A0ABQ4DJ92_9CELL|nr:choice-of-anchor K domain-containing protein [Cellulomonas phragmiteti]GIG38991.1 hypothetical protein Cph01nite_07530 [Cellulomonas phragmiteti]